MTIEAIQERLAIHASEAPAKREREKADNRLAMPLLSAWYDDITKRFGKITSCHLIEGGREIRTGRYR